MATKKTKTIAYASVKEYATVPARLKQFREDCPRGSIETKPNLLPDGTVIFSTTIIKDLKDEHSARSTGSAMGKTTGTKAFEKLETISVGRALALLGYMASGDIASSEEMEEFQAYREEKIVDAIQSLQSVTTLEQLKEVFMGLGNLISEKDVINAKDEMKKKLTPKVKLNEIEELKEVFPNK